MHVDPVLVLTQAGVVAGRQVVKTLLLPPGICPYPFLHTSGPLKIPLWFQTIVLKFITKSTPMTEPGTTYLIQCPAVIDFLTD